MEVGPGTIIVWAILLTFYFFPLIIAWRRDHRNTLAIGMLNLFLGWTLLGWIGALIWACTDSRRREA